MSRFSRWWLGELRDLFPTASANRRLRPSRIVLTPFPDHVVAFTEDKGHAARLEQARDPATILEQISRVAGSRPIGIRVRASDFLDRAVMLPARARKDFDRLLRLDIERSTPLRAADVLSACVVDGAPTREGLVAVRHLIIKRRVVEPLVTAMRAAGTEPAFIECWNDEATAPLPATFSLHGEAPPAAPASSMVRNLAIACCLLLLALPAIDWGRKEVALASLTAEVARLSGAAKAARQSAEREETARAEHEALRRVVENRTPAVVVLEEVTRLVPDGAWLDELRLEGDGLEIAGTAPSAATLLAIFERSRLFFDARFTAPVRLQSANQQEQFRLRARLRAPQSDASR